MENTLNSNISLNKESREIEAKKIRSSVAMTILMVSWAMFFATLFLAYSVFRVSSPVWPPMGLEKVPLATPIQSTLWITLSSIFYYFFQKSTLRGEKSRMKAFLSLTTLAGALFMMSQFSLWNEFKELGLYVRDSTFASILYGFTWIHAGHMALGFAALAWLFIFIKNFKDTEDQRQSLLVKNLGMFWHFLGFIWGLMFLILFLF